MVWGQGKMHRKSYSLAGSWGNIYHTQNTNRQTLGSCGAIPSTKREVPEVPVRLIPVGMVWFDTEGGKK
jgi:hypothetical protein